LLNAFWLLLRGFFVVVFLVRAFGVDASQLFMRGGHWRTSLLKVFAGYIISSFFCFKLMFWFPFQRLPDIMQTLRQLLFVLKINYF